MANFKFKARERTGKLKEGSIKADSAEQARVHFKEQGMILISLNEVADKGALSAQMNFFSGVNLKDIMLFTRQMYALCLAGLPLVSGIKSLEGTCSNLKLKRILGEVRHDIESGASFSAALAKHPKTFDNVYCSSVSAGEASGALPEVMSRLAVSIEKDQETKSRIKQALSYPAIIVFVIIAALVVIGIFVIPRFESMFASFGVDELPQVTKILMFSSKALRQYWYYCLAAVVIGGVAFAKILQTANGRKIFDICILKAPIFGPLIVKISMSRFSLTVATLVKSGVPIVETIDLGARTSGNVVLQGAILNVREKIKEGKNIAVAMAGESIFPPMIVQMVAAGEEAGRLDELMEMVAEYYDKETEIVVKNMTTLIEPILLMFMAAIVVVLALGIFLPLWDLQSSVG